MTILLSRSKCMKPANQLPMASFTPQQRWQCSCYHASCLLQHHLSPTMQTEQVSWDSSGEEINGAFAQGHKEWVQSPASYSGSRAGFIYSSPHTHGRVEYRRQDSSYNQACLCDVSSMCFRELWDCYIHITPSGGRVPRPTFLALGISHQLFTCIWCSILGNESNGSSVSNPSKSRFRAAGYNPRLATGISCEVVFWNWAFHLWDRALLHLSELSWTTEPPPHTLKVNGSSGHHLVLHWGYRKNTTLFRVHRRSINTPIEVRHSQKFLLSRKEKCWHSKL